MRIERGLERLLLRVALVTAPLAVACAAGCSHHRSNGGSSAPLAWSAVAVAGAPPARDGHSMVLDAANDRAIVFGGEAQPGNPPPLLNDVWVLTNASGASTAAPVWSELAPSGVAPSARAFHAAVYAPASNRMIVFGGNPNVGFCGGTLDDVWILDEANGLGGTPTWIQATPSGTPPLSRNEHTAVFDAASDSLIVFGGVLPCGATFSDVWVLSNASATTGTPTWTQLSPTGGIVGRFQHAAAYDATHDRMIVFGGLVGASQSTASPANDVWVLANASGAGGQPAWNQLAPTGTPPSPRYSATAEYDAATNRLIVVGGVSAKTLDVWQLTNANGLGGAPAWSLLAPEGTPPSVRSSSATVLRASRARLTLFGGQDAAGASRNDLYVLSGL